MAHSKSKVRATADRGRCVSLPTGILGSGAERRPTHVVPQSA
jgi:hypothetical protein